MRSRWQRSRGDDPQAPIEMRFIDMFMAALGSLVFLALLLVFLLPKTTQQGTIDNQELKKKLDEVIAENKQLRRQIPTSQAGGANTEEKNIVRRWLGVFLMVRGCSIEPEMYVRWEGNVVNFETEQPTSKLPEFDASDVSHNRDTLVGHKYFDIGNGAEIATIMAKVQESDTAGLKDLNTNGLNAKLFYAVSRRPGSYSVYVGLTDPRAQGERECAIQPFYLSSRGLIPADEITMTQERPFAWLRRFSIETDGTTTLKTSPWQDEVFKRELAEFSNKQSKLLCERKSLCGTIDAHYALLLSRTPTVKLLLSKEEASLKPKDIFKECDECPEMVVVPSGRFIMGSPDSEAGSNDIEGPQYPVAFPHQFAVGRYAVTFEEWDACVADMACKQRSDAGWGRGRRPAINVSWHDAKSYVTWLTNKTGKPYRLLTEEEREYVARAGTETPFWWGSIISSSQANYDGRAKGQYRERTMPVDSFNPNPWGLYQVHGNVSEWTENCYKRYAPTARTNSDCSFRVLRGGSWWNGPASLRSGSRGRHGADSSDNTIGLRVARTIGNVAP
jgi:formylglycine-generating enzyme required for sulfatase activity